MNGKIEKFKNSRDSKILDLPPLYLANGLKGAK